MAVLGKLFKEVIKKQVPKKTVQQTEQLDDNVLKQQIKDIEEQDIKIVDPKSNTEKLVDTDLPPADTTSVVSKKPDVVPSEPLEIGINKKLQDGKFLKRYDAAIAVEMTEKAKNATAGNTRANALMNAEVPEGTKVGIRLNLNSKIPDMPKGLDKLQTLHKGSFSGKALSYLPFATVKNVVFSVSQTGRTGIASKIKGIDTPEAKSKFNAMSVDGEYVPNKNLLDSDEDLVEIGFNPGVHHLFIDLKTGQAVKGAKEATVIGDRVFAKGVEYWKKSEAPQPVPTQTGVAIPSDVRYKFNKGGTVMEEQMEMAFMQDGGLQDEGGTIDKESGNEVPSGSLKKEVRDDIPAMLSEGEFVFPADVVRFIGLNKLMQMRQEAKMGLKLMEKMGQMGNSEEAEIPDDLPFGVTDIIVMESDKKEKKDDKKEMSEGGVLTASNGTDVVSTRDKNKFYKKNYLDADGNKVEVTVDYLDRPISN